MGIRPVHLHKVLMLCQQHFQIINLSEKGALQIIEPILLVVIARVSSTSL